MQISNEFTGGCLRSIRCLPAKTQFYADFRNGAAEVYGPKQRWCISDAEIGDFDLMNRSSILFADSEKCRIASEFTGARRGCFTSRWKILACQLREYGTERPAVQWALNTMLARIEWDTFWSFADDARNEGIREYCGLLPFMTLPDIFRRTLPYLAAQRAVKTRWTGSWFFIRISLETYKMATNPTGHAALTTILSR
jgi:hypothetical protein